MVASLVWGFSTSLWQAMVARAFLAIIAVFLGLRETLVTRKNKTDIGLLLKDKVVQRWTEWKKVYFGDEKSGEREPLLGSSDMQNETLEVVESDSQPQKQEPISWKDILTRQSVLCLIAYSMLGLQSGVYDMYIPIFMYHSRQDPSAIHLPLKFSGGFGSSTQTIGAMYAITGSFSIPFQFFFYPYMARRIGVLKCLKIVTLIYPLIYLLTPFITLLPSSLRLITLFIVIYIKACLTSFSYPCATVMLSQSIRDTRGLGTLNGILTAVSGLARALGPAIGGPSFTIGVKVGYLILPFGIVAGMALLAMPPVFLLRDSASETSDGDIEEE
ncbi:hypothetical protein B7494_g5667 [Chlorociboria aeruginascens]|nr:hypothetical protein B7494_g5667 [Chlorociboria aeruginascens]